MNITRARETYKPFEYPRAFEYWEKQQAVHWLHTEVPMSGDIQDWKQNLTEGERQVIGQILKSFIQSEIHVEDYWSQRVSKWFPKPEVQMMASSFASMESIHIAAYSYLNDSLGIDDYSAFLEDETAVAKLDRLKEVKIRSNRDKAQSLAIFSACTEGINLFSAFAILMNLSRFNLMNGLETIISWSSRDEALHSEAGCWLFNKMVDEDPEMFDDEMKADILDAFRLTIELEDNFIDNAFSLGEIRGLKPEYIKAFIRERANLKLNELGLPSNWRNINQEHLREMKWFSEIDNVWSDFFARKVTEYAKCGWTGDDFFPEEAPAPRTGIMR